MPFIMIKSSSLAILAMTLALGLAGCAPSYEPRPLRSVGYGGIGYGGACGASYYYDTRCSAAPYHGRHHVSPYGPGSYGPVYGPYVAKPAFWGERRLRRTSQILVYYY